MSSPKLIWFQRISNSRHWPEKQRSIIIECIFAQCRTHKVSTCLALPHFSFIHFHPHLLLCSSTLWSSVLLSLSTGITFIIFDSHVHMYADSHKKKELALVKASRMSFWEFILWAQKKKIRESKKKIPLTNAIYP